MTGLEIIVIELRLKRLERDFEALKREVDEVLPILTARERPLIKTGKSKYLIERADSDAAFHKIQGQVF